MSQILKNVLLRKIRIIRLLTTVNLRRITFKYYVEIKVMPKAEVHEFGSQICFNKHGSCSVYIILNAYVSRKFYKFDFVVTLTHFKMKFYKCSFLTFECSRFLFSG